jgi:hypothetical protein
MRLRFLNASIAACLILSTLALIPAPGLVTLTIPDDTPGTASVSVPDLPQFAKRAHNQFSDAFAFFLNAFTFLFIVSVIFGIAFRRESWIAHTPSLFLPIRAPPVS